MVPLPVDCNGWDIKSEAGQFVAQRFALCRDKAPMQLLFKRAEVLHGLGRLATLTQKVLEVIHRVGITGQEVTALQCLHGDSPLA
jgi:hypothetical protein